MQGYYNNYYVPEEYYGINEDSYKICSDCEGIGQIIDMASPVEKMMTCPKCNGEKELLMEFEEYIERVRDRMCNEVDDNKE